MKQFEWLDSYIEERQKYIDIILANKKINVKMIDQGSSELNIIVGVKNIHFNDAIRAIYNTFIEQE
mgnify:CR=1 FL=1